jgi:hypothetical protein
MGVCFFLVDLEGAVFFEGVVFFEDMLVGELVSKRKQG